MVHCGLNRSRCKRTASRIRRLMRLRTTALPSARGTVNPIRGPSLPGSRTQKAAKRGPVFITDRGRPAHVLLSIEEYQKLKGKQKTIVDMLAMPGIEEIEFEPPRIGDEFRIAPDLS